MLPAPRTHAEIQGNLALWQAVHDVTRVRLTMRALRLARTELLFSYWQVTHDYPRARYDPKDQRTRLLMTAQEKNEDDVSQLLFVSDGALKDRHLMGEKADSDRKYDGIETIYKTVAMIERLSDLGGYRGDPHPVALKYPALCLNGHAERAGQGELL